MDFSGSCPLSNVPSSLFSLCTLGVANGIVGLVPWHQWSWWCLLTQPSFISTGTIDACANCL